MAERERGDPMQSWLDDGHLGGLVAASAAGRRLLRSVLRTAMGSGPVLVRGPAGSGKAAVARAVHRLSPIPGPLVQVWSAAELADCDPTGTCVLPDLDRWSIAEQRQVIAHLDRGVGPRLIALSREPDPSPSIDPRLLHRLSLDLIDVPALSARPEDVELLAIHHLERLPPDEDGHAWHLTTEAAAALRSHPWQGNVRELFSTLERAAERAQLTPIRRIHLGLASRRGQPEPANRTVMTLAELERHHVEATLQAFNGNVTEAGRALGIPRSTLYRKLKRWGLVGQARGA